MSSKAVDVSELYAQEFSAARVPILVVRAADPALAKRICRQMSVAREYGTWNYLGIKNPEGLVVWHVSHNPDDPDRGLIEWFLAYERSGVLPGVPASASKQVPNYKAPDYATLDSVEERFQRLEPEKRRGYIARALDWLRENPKRLELVSPDIAARMIALSLYAKELNHA